MRGDEFDAVAFAHVVEGIVPGEHFAPCLRHAVELGLRPLVHGIEAGLVAVEALLVISAALRVDFNQRVGHVLGIGFHQHGIVPHVRIEFAVMVVAVVMTVAVVVMAVIMIVVVIIVVVVFGLHRLDVFGGLGKRHAALADAAHHRSLLKTQAVHQYELGIADALHIAAGEVVGMRVLVGADQVAHVHALATHLFGHVAQNAEARHHFQRRGIQATGKQRGNQAEFPMLQFHLLLLMFVCHVSLPARP